MAVDRDLLERQLQHANAALTERVKALDAGGVETKQRRLDPKWRSLNARCRQLRRRIRAAQVLLDLDQELKRRKAEAVAQE